MNKDYLVLTEDSQPFQFTPINKITFTINGENIIIITPDKFTYKGESFDDIDSVYNSFVDFLTNIKKYRFED